MSHEIRRAELDDVEIGFAKVLFVSQKRCEKSIRLFRNETINETPVKQPRRLMEHRHWTFRKSVFKEIFDPAYSGLFNLLSRLLIENLTCK